MESKSMNYQKDKLKFEEKKIKDQAKEIEEQEKRIKEREPKDMTQYKEVTVKVLVMDSKKNGFEEIWLTETINDGLLETEGEKIISIEVGQPFEK